MLELKTIRQLNNGTLEVRFDDAFEPLRPTKIVLLKQLDLGDIVIPVGFESDLDSGPLNNLFKFSAIPYAVAALEHDWSYRNNRFTRAVADRRFRLRLAQLGMGFFRRWTWWTMLRLFG